MLKILLDLGVFLLPALKDPVKVLEPQFGQDMLVWARLVNPLFAWRLFLCLPFHFLLFSTIEAQHAN